MRIVLDLATSWFWNRPPVGIVRTERKFAQFLLSHEEVPVVFCRYDKTLGRHVAVDTAVVRRLLGIDEAVEAPAIPVVVETPVHSPHVPAAVPGPAPAAPPSEPKPPLKLRVKRAVKRSGFRLVHRLPEPLRPEALQVLRTGKVFAQGVARVASGYATFRRMQREEARRLHPSPALPDARGHPPRDVEAFVFEPDDVYFSMGLDWEYNNVEQVFRERRRVGFRTVLFCYDTIPVRFPHLMSFDARQHFARYFVDVAHAADRVVAISKTSRDDFLALMRETGAPQPPVDVVHLGTDLDVPEAAVRPPLASLEGREFVLCVSTIEARKNHDVLYNAWDRLAQRHGDALLPLVIVGMVGWGVADLLFRMRVNPRLKDRILILDNLADGELAWLYRHCLFTVFPSLYEGWGLPVVESLALGKPCICSTAPAVVEAAQGMAQALDPLDAPAWVAAIERLWTDAAAREDAARRLRRDYRPETWRNHGERMLAVAHAARKG
jgi:glycosyltransferase involved in cell wall biosynthesis